MKIRPFLAAAVGLLSAWTAWAYLSKPISAPFISGALIHDDLTRFAYRDDLAALGLSDKIAWDTFPDLLKFENHIRLADDNSNLKEHVFLDSFFCLVSSVSPLTECDVRDVENAHMGTDQQM